MLSMELIRNEPDRVRASLARRGYAAPIDRVLEIDACRRNVLSKADIKHSNEFLHNLKTSVIYNARFKLSAIYNKLKSFTNKN